MSVSAILFDLDGTLLPMDQEIFVKSYFQRLAMKLAPLGYESKPLFACLMEGIEAMVRNDGTCTNDTAFWAVFERHYGKEKLADQPVFQAFYENEFQEVAKDCGFNPDAAQAIRILKEKGFRLLLATNPLFPAIATESRIRWAGLNKDDFELVTTYENSHFCKPNLDYYREILEKAGLKAEDCLMVGNDAGEDLIAEKLGMKVFLLTDDLINRKNMDIYAYPQGSFAELMMYVNTL